MDDDVPDPNLVRLREEFIAFVQRLRSATAARPIPDWDSRNWDLDSFLDAIAAWFTDARGEQLPAEVPWGLLATTLWVGRIYE